MTRLQEKLTRIALGFAALGALAVGLWPTVPTEFNPEKALAIATAIVGWLAAEWFLDSTSAKGAALSEHDEALANSIAHIASEDYLHFLKHHDFGGAWPEERLAPTFLLHSKLDQIRSEFEDKNLRSNTNLVKIALDSFVSSIGQYTWDHPVNRNLQTAIPDNERGNLHSAETDARIFQLNEQATLLQNALQKLLMIFRSRGMNLTDTI